MDLHIIHINIYQILNRKQQLIEYLHDNKIDIACINETKLDQHKSLSIPNYNILRKDRNTHGGGVAIFIRKSL